MAVITTPASEVQKGDVLDLAGQGMMVRSVAIDNIYGKANLSFEGGGYVYLPPDAILNVQRPSLSEVVYAALVTTLTTAEWIYQDQTDSEYRVDVTHFVEAVIQAIQGAGFEIRCTQS